MRAGYFAWINNLSDDDKIKMSDFMSSISKTYWDNLTYDEFVHRSREIAISSNETEIVKEINNKNEMAFADILK